jgi:hypothetical protein
MLPEGAHVAETVSAQIEIVLHSDPAEPDNQRADGRRFQHVRGVDMRYRSAEGCASNMRQMISARVQSSAVSMS